MKSLRTIIACGLVAGAFSFGGSRAMAQGGGPSNLQYAPTPAVSPYLNLFVNPNAVGNYQLNVAPLLEQSNINAQQNASINQLQNELNQVRSTSGVGTTGASNRIRPTGHASAYMDGSHYFLHPLK